MAVGWFGQLPFASVCHDVAKVATPTEQSCLWCGEPIIDGDNGLMVAYSGEKGHSIEPQHEFCALRSIIGGVNHQAGECICCGGDLPPDPPDLTKRQAAHEAAVYYYESMRPKRGPSLDRPQEGQGSPPSR